MALSTSAVMRLLVAAADQTLGNEIATAVNQGQQLAGSTDRFCDFVITATSTSATTDFGALAVGDLVIAVPAGAGGAVNGYVIATAGTLPALAVVGSKYMVFRALDLTASTTSNKF